MLITLAAVGLLASQPVDLDRDWNAARAWARENSSSFLRVELETLGGPLPFVLEVDHGYKIEESHEELMDQFWFPSWVVTGDERIEVKMGLKPGGVDGPARARIKFDQYNSIIEMTGTGSCTTPSVLPRNFFRLGTWTKKRGDEDAVVHATAEPVDSIDDRFDELDTDEEPASFSGRWRVDFHSSDGPAIGVFEVDENQIATGTFLTTTGDYRYLAGRVDGNVIRLSAFDGAHAFLFRAYMTSRGTIEGDFWSGNWYHETWTAVRDDDAQLPDAFDETTIADESKLDDMVFKDLAGVPTRVLDLLDRTNANARIIEVFGTWCPNCADAGRELVGLKSKYGEDLAVVGLAFEITDDFERSVTQVQRHHDHIGSDWPILIAGLSDKAKASEALPVLDKVRSYPTLIFLNKHNEVQAVYTGFSGPATGDAYLEQRARFESVIEKMINE